MRHSIVATLAMAVAFASSSVLAVTHTWNGTTNSMALNTNWLGNVTPLDGDSNLTLVFPTGAFISPNQDIASPLSVQMLQIDPSVFLNFNGNAYQMNNLGAAPSISIGTGSSVSFVAPVEFNAAGTVTLATSSSGSFADFDVTAPTQFNLGENSNLSLGDMSGVNLTLNGTGINAQTFVTLGGANANTLTGTNTFSGFGLYHLLKPANVAAVGGDVVVSSTSQFQQAQLRANNANQFAAGTDLSIINFGAFQVFANQTINDIELSSGGGSFIAIGTTLTVQGDIISNGLQGSLGSGTGTVDFNGQFKTVNTTVGGVNDILDISAAIANGRINKIGPGKLRLFNTANTFSGVNEANGGTLAGTSATIGNVLNNSTVELLGFGDILTTNQINGPGQVVITGQTEYQAAQGYTGGTTIQGATLIGTTSTLLGNIGSVGGGFLTINQATNGTFTGSTSGPLNIQKMGNGVVSLGGTNTHTGATALLAGGINILSDTGLGNGQLQIFAGTLEATGTRVLANPILIAATMDFVGAGDMHFTDATAKTFNNGTITHNSGGTTEIDGKFSLLTGGTIVVNAGNLILGDASLVGGFTAAAPIVVNGGTLTVRSLNFTTLPDVTLAGGTLNAPNGYAIPLGAALQGNGGVTGRVASANGSSIIANGNLTLGDIAHPAGVNLDGELYTNQNTVVMNDSNQSVLGSLTDLGTATQDGTLFASNGFVLNFGRNIIGRGQIQSNNTLADAAIINGDVNGDSAINFLEFTGYVKGVGTFNNVAFSGTFSPGLSPTLMTIGNVILTPTNVLDIELGGLSRGSQYDAFDINTLLTLDGTLKVQLINTFNPSLGDQFLLFQGPQTGAFDNFDFSMAPLTAGLVWDTSLLYSNGILQVVEVPEPATIVLVAMMSVGLCGRRRR
jgi:autotransporter-associated beta strand protein